MKTNVIIPFLTIVVLLLIGASVALGILWAASQKEVNEANLQLSKQLTQIARLEKQIENLGSQLATCDRSHRPARPGWGW